MNEQEQLRAMAADIRKGKEMVLEVDGSYLYSYDNKICACALGAIIVVHHNGDVPDEFMEGNIQRQTDMVIRDETNDASEETIEELIGQQERSLERILSYLFALYPVLQSPGFLCECTKYFERWGKKTEEIPLYNMIIHISSRHRWTFEQIATWLENQAARLEKEHVTV